MAVKQLQLFSWGANLHLQWHFLSPTHSLPFRFLSCNYFIFWFHLCCFTILLLQLYECIIHRCFRVSHYFLHHQYPVFICLFVKNPILDNMRYVGITSSLFRSTSLLFRNTSLLFGTTSLLFGTTSLLFGTTSWEQHIWCTRYVRIGTLMSVIFLVPQTSYTTMSVWYCLIKMFMRNKVLLKSVSFFLGFFLTKPFFQSVHQNGKPVPPAQCI